MNHKGSVPRKDLLDLQGENKFERRTIDGDHCTSFEHGLALTVERVDSIDAVSMISRTDDTFAIIDVGFTSRSRETRLTSTTKDDIVALQDRMALDGVVQTRLG